MYIRHPEKSKLSVKLGQKGKITLGPLNPSSEEAYVKANENCSCWFWRPRLCKSYCIQTVQAKAGIMANFLHQLPAFEKISAKEIEDVSLRPLEYYTAPGN